MKSKAYQILMAGLLMGIMDPGIKGSKNYELTDKEIKELGKIKEQKMKQIQLNRGLKIFNIDGFEVIALNKKNAIRKVNKLKS